MENDDDCTSFHSESYFNVVLPNALITPGIERLGNKRVLPSASPRRKEILRVLLRIWPDREVIPSTSPENLPPSSFEQTHEYPVATATRTAVEVYKRLVEADPDDPPDLVVGADTVVFMHALPATTPEVERGTPQELLEKPTSKADVVRPEWQYILSILTAPGYAIRELDGRSLVSFAENSRHVFEAYVENGEGIDRSGGFAVQGLGAPLICKVDGDYNIVAGFPGTAAFKMLDILVEEVDFLTI
ncbi:Maf Ham1 [Pisolithus thermaeus]|nr:Maf Ham1 [Pisolithus croceorrhizus]KAI6151433.1 Maf Ham1 [Pisolithus thermaeus]